TENRVVREDIHLVALVGNPTMTHLFLGINPIGLAGFPFTPAFSNLLTLSASETGLNLPRHTKLEILPLISGYVGADTVAAALAVDLDFPGPPRLLLDIGTNGEVVLACRDKIWACSTAAGPALEGGAIKFGTRAEPGAISAVTIADDVHLSVIGMAVARGLCGSGLLDAVAQLHGRGLLHPTGRFKDSADLPPGLPLEIRRRLTPGEKGKIFYLTPEVYLTQSDINQLQLAKGALRAGIEILMAEAGIALHDVEEILLAGAFGSSLNPQSLLTVGLLPPFPLEKIKAVGNAAGLGAVLCLLSETHHQRALALAGKTNHLELSLQKNFQEKFLQGLKFY
ncbi:MAG: ASKHA domain-containing protein, partial [Thermodesulfobacteriota bacterium]